MSKIIRILSTALLLLGSVVQAGVIFDNDEYLVRPGEVFRVKWVGHRAPVNITLMDGEDANLQVELVIATFAKGSYYDWTPPMDLDHNSYLMRLEDGVSTDYSARFVFPGPPDPTPDPSSTESDSSTPTESDAASDSASATPAPSPGLSNGAIAGIAVACSVVGIIILVAAGCFIYKRGQKNALAKHQEQLLELQQQQQQVQELYNNYPGDDKGGAAGGQGGIAPGDQYALAMAAAKRSHTPFVEIGSIQPNELWSGPVDVSRDRSELGTPQPHPAVQQQYQGYSVPLQEGPGGGTNTGTPAPAYYQDQNGNMMYYGGVDTKGQGNTFVGGQPQQGQQGAAYDSTPTLPIQAPIPTTPQTQSRLQELSSDPFARAESTAQGYYGADQGYGHVVYQGEQQQQQHSAPGAAMYSQYPIGTNNNTTNQPQQQQPQTHYQHVDSDSDDDDDQNGQHRPPHQRIASTSSYASSDGGGQGTVGRAGAVGVMPTIPHDRAPSPGSDYDGGNHNGSEYYHGSPQSQTSTVVNSPVGNQQQQHQQQRYYSPGPGQQ